MLVDESFRYKITDFDRQVFACFLRADNPLVLACAEIDWARFRGILSKYYSPKLGQPAIDPLRMLQLEFLKYRYNLSDRQVVDRLHTDLSFRYFLQVGRAFQPPDPSSMCRFRARLGPEGFAEIFDTLVAQAREAGLVKDRLRLKDASHTVASIAVRSTLTLVAEIRDRLLKAAEPFDAEWVSGQQIETSLLRQRTKDQQDESRLAARVTHLQELVAWGDMLTVPVEAEADSRVAKAWEKFQKTLALAHKILDDRQEGSNRKTISVADPEARRGRHGEYYDGYMTDILMDADSEIITEINVLEAGGDEARDAVDMVRSEQEAHGNQIENLSIDGAGFNGQMLRELEGPAEVEGGGSDTAEGGLGVTTFVPPKAEPTGERFAASEFTLNSEGTAVTCPAGETSKYHQRNRRRNATIFRFTRSQCDKCAMVELCMPKPHEGAFGRSLSKNDYEAEYQRARARAKTEQYAAVRREHPAVERKLNELMNHHGGRRARYWGRSKVHIQQLMTGMVVNTKRIVTLLAKVRAESAVAAKPTLAQA